jgi:large conductance mechanosensitive channel
LADSKATSKEIRKAKAAATRAAAAERARLHREKLKETRTAQHFGGFVEFMRQQGVIGLAIGLVLGVQIKALVDQLVASFINPILGLVMPGPGSLSAKSFTLSVGSKQAVFTYGAFLEVLISFLIVALVVYILFRMLRLDKLDKKK